MAGEQAQPRAPQVTGPEITEQVHLVVGCQVYDLGMITRDPEHRREGLAGLLRECAAEIAGETTGEPCPADG